MAENSVYPGDAFVVLSRTPTLCVPPAYPGRHNPMVPSSSAIRMTCRERKSLMHADDETRPLKYLLGKLTITDCGA